MQFSPSLWFDQNEHTFSHIVSIVSKNIHFCLRFIKMCQLWMKNIIMEFIVHSSSKKQQHRQTVTNHTNNKPPPSDWFDLLWQIAHKTTEHICYDGDVNWVFRFPQFIPFHFNSFIDDDILYLTNWRCTSTIRMLRVWIHIKSLNSHTLCYLPSNSSRGAVHGCHCFKSTFHWNCKSN